MKKVRLSIIVPVYNVERYIKRCLDSVYLQKVDETLFEIVVVDDGSTDKTMTIVEGFVSVHSNILTIRQNNAGAAVARNAGLAVANGDYIWYVDSDDAIAAESIATVFHYLDLYPKADFLVFDCRQLDFEKNTDNYWRTLNDRCWGILHQNLYFKKLDRTICGHRIRSAVLWLLIYRKDYLIEHDLFLTEGIINEDNEFFMRLFFFAQEIRYIPFAHYLYTLYRPGSVTTLNMHATKKMLLAASKTIEVWTNFCAKYVHNSKDENFVSRYFVAIYTRLLSFQNADKNSEVYAAYLTHKEEWKCGLKQYFDKGHFSAVEHLRYLSILYFPQYYDMISLLGIKMIFKKLLPWKH